MLACICIYSSEQLSSSLDARKEIPSFRQVLAPRQCRTMTPLLFILNVLSAPIRRMPSTNYEQRKLGSKPETSIFRRGAWRPKKANCKLHWRSSRGHRPLIPPIHLQTRKQSAHSLCWQRRKLLKHQKHRARVRLTTKTCPRGRHSSNPFRSLPSI